MYTHLKPRFQTLGMYINTVHVCAFNMNIRILKIHCNNAE